MSGDSWTHLMVRPLVRPLIGTWVRPNHLTTARLLTGLAACACLAWGTRAAVWWGGGLWLVSAALDRADGELARLGKLMSPGGHVYDYWTDTAVNSLFFVAAGVGLRGSWLGIWAVVLGIVAGACLWLLGIVSEALERRSPPDTRAWAGRWGFDPDDALYLLGPLAWAGLLAPVLIATAPTASAILAATWIRFRRLPAPVRTAR